MKILLLINIKVIEYYYAINIVESSKVELAINTFFMSISLIFYMSYN